MKISRAFYNNALHSQMHLIYTCTNCYRKLISQKCDKVEDPQNGFRALLEGTKKIRQKFLQKIMSAC